MISFIDKNFSKLVQLAVSLLLIIPAWITVWYWWNSNPHMILGTNIISGVMGFWLGTSISSALKDEKKIGG